MLQPCVRKKDSFLAQILSLPNQIYFGKHGLETASSLASDEAQLTAVLGVLVVFRFDMMNEDCAHVHIGIRNIA